MFLFEDILCRWGAVKEVITDNGMPYITALDWLMDRYCYAQTLRKRYACSLYGYGSVGKWVPVLEPLILMDPPTWNL